MPTKSYPVRSAAGSQRHSKMRHVRTYPMNHVPKTPKGVRRAAR